MTPPADKATAGRKRKFRIGQVVYVRKSGIFVKLIPRGYGPDKNEKWFMCNDGYIRHVCRFRPLTKREANL